MTGIVVVTVGAVVGSVARFILDATSRRRFGPGPSPGILLANVLGSFLLGVLVGLMATRFVDDRWRLLVGVGFCGSFTTFSSFVVELADLVGGARGRMLVAWTAAAVIGGGVAASLGLALGRTW